MNYEYGQSMFDKAEEYHRTCKMLQEREIFDSSLAVLNELVLECYLCGLIEQAKGKSVDDIYGKGRVPHSLTDLYRDATTYSALSYKSQMMKDLRSAFQDYKALRFPKPDTRVLVDEEAIKYNCEITEDLIDMIKDMDKDIER